MRSQLDCYDSRLPGTGVFDLKTRAAFPIRMDRLNFKVRTEINIFSFIFILDPGKCKLSHPHSARTPREFWEGILRSYTICFPQVQVREWSGEQHLSQSNVLTFLSFQARIGNMDGVMVAYHNTERIFGFQYVPLEDMDVCLFGSTGSGWRVFDKCIRLLEIVSQEIVNCFPGKASSAVLLVTLTGWLVDCASICVVRFVHGLNDWSSDACLDRTTQWWGSFQRLSFRCGEFVPNITDSRELAGHNDCKSHRGRKTQAKAQSYRTIRGSPEAFHWRQKSLWFSSHKANWQAMWVKLYS